MDAVKRIYRFLSSMKTGLTLLVLVGLASALGSAFLPDTFFDTLFFKLLLIFLLINMLLCTANRLIIFKSGFQIKIKRGWAKHIGGLLLHIGIVLILAGLIMNTYSGESGQIRIQTGDHVGVSNTITVKKPFSLQLDEFKMEFHEDGSPSQYYSYVTVLENDEAVERAVISVNHPLKHNGVKFYQQSYGHLIKAKHMDAAGNEVEDLINEGKFLTLQGTERLVKVYRYLPNFDPDQGMTSKTMRPDNPRIVFSVYENDKVLGVGAAEFGERVKIDDGVYVVFTGVEPFTVLKAKSDPGLPLAAGGGVVFIIGISLALLVAPARRKNMS
ncbi:MAG TPA: cytochrome c biogenesis protein ResB [Syntrophomonadaceae bacterium]|nr:cytochrome c biogenesis protein ResB [Syntrophomonadaceae bacterium]